MQRYRHGHFEVEALQHDGTDKSAEEIARWVRNEKGRIDILLAGEFDYDLDNAYLRLYDRYDRLIQPYFWVVRVYPGTFYSVHPDVFKNLYELIEEEQRDDTTAETDLRPSVST